MSDVQLEGFNPQMPDGGDPDPTPDPNPEPDNGLVEVNIGGQKYMVNKEMATAMQAQEAQRKAELESFRSDLLEQMRMQTQQPATPVEPAQSDADDLFSDPEGYLAKREQRLREEITQEVTSKYQQEQSAKAFWEKFYQQNSDLKDADLTVKAILQRDYSEISKLSYDEASATLSDRTRQELLKLGVKREASPAPHVESPSSPTNQSGAPQTPQTDAPPNATLSTIINKRTEARRAARSNR